MCSRVEVGGCRHVANDGLDLLLCVSMRVVVVALVLDAIEKLLRQSSFQTRLTLHGVEVFVWTSR